MGMGTVEPIGGTDTLSFIRGAIHKYKGKNVDGDLIEYIEHQVGPAEEFDPTGNNQ